MSRDDLRHQALREALAAYALGALDADEHIEIEAHLSECAACRADLRWLAPAIDVLPASVEQRVPPPRLKAELMSTVRREAAQARRAERATDSRGRLAASVEGFGRMLLRPAAALGAVALVVVVVGIALLSGGSPDPASQRSFEARGLGSEADEVSASFVVGDPDEGGSLEVRELPRVDRGHVYQLWIQRGDELEPSSTFAPGEGGTAHAVTQSLEGADAVLLTREPRAGSEQPTTPALAKVALSGV